MCMKRAPTCKVLANKAIVASVSTPTTTTNTTPTNGLMEHIDRAPLCVFTCLSWTNTHTHTHKRAQGACQLAPLCCKHPLSRLEHENTHTRIWIAWQESLSVAFTSNQCKLINSRPTPTPTRAQLNESRVSCFLRLFVVAAAA